MIYVPFASFHYAVIQDTFLYTASTDVYGLHCINIANPESIFVAWSMDYYFGFNGLSIVDSIVYTSISSKFWVDPESDAHQRPRIQCLVAKIERDTTAEMLDIEYMENVHHGSIASDGTNVFYVHSELSDFIWGVQDYTLGDSYLEIWGTDYSYSWADYDSEGVFGVEVLNDTILAVGFEHGFSIVNYTQLAGMTEVAYYRDTDSIYCFTHFARKGNRMYAMAHPREGICRMYMFELDSTIWTSIEDPVGNKGLQPLAFEISSWPNPFNSAVTIAIDMPSVETQNLASLQIEIYDVAGRKIDVIARRCPEPVEGRVQPDEAISYGYEKDCHGLRPRNDSGLDLAPLTKGGQALEPVWGGSYVWRPDQSLPSGVYLVRASADGRGDLDPTEKTATKRIVYLK